MTDDFLRLHPEIADRFSTYFDGSIDSREIMADILPLILRAHEADLAGEVGNVYLDELALALADDLDRGILTREAFAGDFARRIRKERAAAYLAGRAAGREEAAAKAREYAGHYPQGSDGRNTFILLAEWLEAQGSLP